MRSPDRDNTTPTPDPPIVAALIGPLLGLRATLGTSTGTPDPALVTALRASTSTAAATNAEHQAGVYALESTLETRADALPTMRRTRAEVATLTDQAPHYLEVLADAHTSNADAARRVDSVIARFRRDAGEEIAAASTESGTDRVLALASTAFRDALAAVSDARTRMDGHEATLRGLAPVALSTPASWSPAPGVVPIPRTLNEADTGQSYAIPYGTTPSGNSQLGTGGPTQPVDPALSRAALEAQIQTELIRAGVTLATSLIDAGVELGGKIVDRVADVGGKAIDTVAAGVNEAVKEGLRPNTNGTPAQPPPSTPGKPFEFGPAPAPPASPPSKPAPAPTPPAQSAPVEPKPTPPPAPPFGGDKPTTPAPAPPAPAPAGAVPPSVAPSPAPPERPRKSGQLGVTEPAAAEPPAGPPIVEPGR